jgi:hypothetical protein
MSDMVCPRNKAPGKYSYSNVEIQNPRRMSAAGFVRPLLREDHREVAKDRQQDAGHGVSDRESDPRHSAVDFDRSLAAWARM